MSFVHDMLKYQNDPNIKKFIRDETIIYSNKVEKINKFGFNQDRILIVTDAACYNLKKSELKRRIEMSNIRGLTVSTISNEIIIHGEGQEYDYYYNTKEKKLIVKAFHEAKSKNGSELQFAKINDKSISNYVTKKDEKKKDLSFSRMPLSVSNVNDFLDGVTSNLSNTNTSSNTQKTSSNTPSVPNVPNVPSVPSVPSVPKVPNVPSVPSVPNISVVSGKGAPKIPGNIPNIPKIPEIVPLNKLANVEVVKSDTAEQSQADRLKELQAKMGNLKQAEEQATFDKEEANQHSAIQEKKGPNMRDQLAGLMAKRFKQIGGDQDDDDGPSNQQTSGGGLQPQKTFVPSVPQNQGGGGGLQPTKTFTPSVPQNQSGGGGFKPSVPSTNQPPQTQKTISQPPITSNTGDGGDDVPMDFASKMKFMMGAFGKQGGGGSSSTPQNTNAELNAPKKDHTGKIVIDVPEGTKASDRMDINKMINQANKLKEKQEKENKTSSKQENIAVRFILLTIY